MPSVYNGDVVAVAVSAAGDLYVVDTFRGSEASVGADWRALGTGAGSVI